MKSICIAVCCTASLFVQAQTSFTKSYPAQPNQQINLNFDYPVVKVSTWDKNEVSVVAHVNINSDENDSAFVLEGKTANGALEVSGRIRDLDKLPHRYTIFRSGKKMTFTSKDQYLQERKNGGIERTYEGTDIDIVVEVKIPEHSKANIKAVYGIVELTNLNTSVTVDATYGGIDAALSPARTGKLKATTRYGKIYSNLELKLTDHTERDFYNSITAEPGTGPDYSFTSTYGKIYLRKS